MVVKMKEPDIAAIREAFCLPDDILFLGYILYNLEGDDFLCHYKNNACSILVKWDSFPEHAMRFATYHQAEKTFKCLDHFCKCVVSLLFSVDERYFVLSPLCDSEEFFSEMTH